MFLLLKYSVIIHDIKYVRREYSIIITIDVDNTININSNFIIVTVFASIKIQKINLNIKK